MKLNFIQRLRNFETFSQKNEPYRVKIQTLSMKLNFIQSNLSFGDQMAGCRATIKIEVFQLANNGLAVEISPFLRARRKKLSFES